MGNNYGNIGESQQHQLSTAAAQQQRVSDTTTGRDKRKKCPRWRDRSSSISIMVKIDGMSIRGREAARGHTNRNLHSEQESATDYAASMETAAAATQERQQSRRRVVRQEHRRTGIQHVQP